MQRSGLRNNPLPRVIQRSLLSYSFNNAPQVLIVIHNKYFPNKYPTLTVCARLRVIKLNKASDMAAMIADHGHTPELNA